MKEESWQIELTAYENFGAGSTEYSQKATEPSELVEDR